MGSIGCDNTGVGIVDETAFALPPGMGVTRSELGRARRPTVAVDVDEVLAFFVPALCRFHNQQYRTRLTPSDFHSYRFSQVWGGTDVEAVERVHEFFRTPAFEELQPVPGANETLRARRDRFRFVVVTSRQTLIEQPTRRWLSRHFDGIFEDVYFGNQWVRGQGVPTMMGSSAAVGRRSKADMCHEAGAMLLVDDMPAYVDECARAGMRGILFDYQQGYGWSKAPLTMPHRVTVAHDWTQVGRVLDALVPPLDDEGTRC
ncbi:hypothetical protein CDCA_CDCA08G2482 [Cyanidium caldarium]|uniref:Uncharacterized protein n=1 Tax=Cyanidium caldarium TaxID=2771 RepID=A0AAV9IVV2_CYACA|nr:hypothetical protein CDCA_CDCA08G2482 [Cyanidium caldarium]